MLSTIYYKRSLVTHNLLHLQNNISIMYLNINIMISYFEQIQSKQIEIVRNFLYKNSEKNY